MPIAEIWLYKCAQNTMALQVVQYLYDVHEAVLIGLSYRPSRHAPVEVILAPLGQVRHIPASS